MADRVVASRHFLERNELWISLAALAGSRGVLCELELSGANGGSATITNNYSNKTGAALNGWKWLYLCVGRQSGMLTLLAGSVRCAAGSETATAVRSAARRATPPHRLSLGRAPAVSGQYLWFIINFTADRAFIQHSVTFAARLVKMHNTAATGWTGATTQYNQAIHHCRSPANIPWLFLGTALQQHQPELKGLLADRWCPTCWSNPRCCNISGWTAAREGKEPSRNICSVLSPVWSWSILVHCPFNANTPKRHAYSSGW